MLRPVMEWRGVSSRFVEELENEAQVEGVHYCTRPWH